MSNVIKFSESWLAKRLLASHVGFRPMETVVESKDRTVPVARTASNINEFISLRVLEKITNYKDSHYNIK